MSLTEETTFEPEVEHILKYILSAEGTTHKIRIMLEANQLLDYWSFMQLDRKAIYSLTCEMHRKGCPIKLNDTLSQKLVNAVEYIVYHEENGDHVLVNDPTKWVVREFNKWVYEDKQKGKCKAKITPKEDVGLIEFDQRKNNNKIMLTLMIIILQLQQQHYL